MTSTREVSTSSSDAGCSSSDNSFMRKKGPGAGKGPHSKEKVLPALGTHQIQGQCLKVDLERPDPCVRCPFPRERLVVRISTI